jgi:hypothetical protein
LNNIFQLPSDTRGTALLSFLSAADAQEAVSRLDGSLIDGFVASAELQGRPPQVDGGGFSTIFSRLGKVKETKGAASDVFSRVCSCSILDRASRLTLSFYSSVLANYLDEKMRLTVILMMKLTHI